MVWRSGRSTGHGSAERVQFAYRIGQFPAATSFADALKRRYHGKWRKIPAGPATAYASDMFELAIVFAVLALIAAIFGFGGIASQFAGIAKILLIIFVILAIVAFVL